MQRTVVFGCMGLWLAACVDEQSNLPAGWEGAQLVEDFHQRPCSGSVAENTPGELEVTAAESGISVAWDHAQFYCEQPLEAYVRRSSRALDLLVQAVDMHPFALAGCDCLYDISMDVPAPRGDYKLTLYRRDVFLDNLGGEDSDTEPKRVHKAEVSVE